MVAPSFQTYTMIVAEPFMNNGKLYVTVEHPNTHNHRNVRWYTEAEYTKLYGGEKKTEGFKGLKQARGFANGPITLIRNRKGTDEAWLNFSNARYATDVGWYVVSTEELSTPYPSHFRFITLTWDEFKLDETHPKSVEELSKIILSKEKRGEYKWLLSSSYGI